MVDIQFNASHEETVNSLIDLMKKKFNDSSLTLEYLAKQSHYSPFYLDRIFRNITGIPPRAFLSALRMEEAKKRLLSGSQNATEIGQDVGYNSFGTFSSRFAQYVGISPSRFRSCVKECVAQLRVYHGMNLPPVRQEPKSQRGITGSVSIPGGFDGFVCVGLFPKPIPVGSPVACTLLFETGKYWIPPVPDGTYYALCAAFPWDASEEELLFPRKCFRGKSSGSIYVAGGKAAGSADISLRSPRLYDPPILVSMPMLLLNFLERYQKSQRESAN